MQRKTKKPSTLHALASKRRKIEITPAMQLVPKKIATNGSPLISLKRVQKTKKRSLNSINRKPTQIRNRRKWTSLFASSDDELDNAYTFNVRKNMPPFRRTMSAKAINNLTSVIKAVAEGSRQLPHVPLPMPSVSTNSIPQMTQISSRQGAGRVKQDPVAAEKRKAAPKKVQPSSPSLLPKRSFFQRTAQVDQLTIPIV